MNRREFTASLAALVTSPTLPLPVAPAAAAPVAATNSMAYMFADLIARSRGSVDAGFLARRLQLPTDAASQIMGDLAANGVVRAPGLGGVARAVSPFEFQLPLQSPKTDMADTMRDALDKLIDEPDVTPDVEETLSSDEENPPT